MSSKTDEIKGKAKEKTGKLTGNRDLEREGKVDQVKGKTKEAVDKAGEKIKKEVS